MKKIIAHTRRRAVFATVAVFVFALFSLGATRKTADEPFRHYLPKTQVKETTSDGETIWVATYGKGIRQYIPSEDRWIEYSSEAGNLKSDFFYCIAASPEYVWAGASDGLFIYDRKSDRWTKRRFAMGGQYGNWIRALYYDAEDDVLWIGRFQNLTKHDVARRRFTDYSLRRWNDEKTNNFKSIAKERDRWMWFGCEAGVYRYDKTMDLKHPSAVTFYHNRGNGFRGEGDYASVSDILVDLEYVYFATDEFYTTSRDGFNQGGLFRFNRRASWEKIDARNGLPANGVSALARTGNAVWAGVYDFDPVAKQPVGRGLALVDRVSGDVRVIEPDELYFGKNVVNDLFFDGAAMWVSTDAGLWKITMTNPLATWNPR